MKNSIQNKGLYSFKINPNHFESLYFHEETYPWPEGKEVFKMKNLQTSTINHVESLKRR